MVRPTMSDVAKAASVSTSTVSRALAGDERVKEATRHHIVEVAERLGYTPNRTAAALRRGKTWMIGIVTPGTPRAFSDPFYLEFLGGLGDRAMEAGYNLVIAAPSGVKDAVATASPRGLDLEGLIAQGAVDAVALTEPEENDGRLAVLRQYNVPFAFLGTVTEGGEVPADVSFVDGDNVGNAREAVEHLIGLGHTRIACLSGEAGLVASRQRLDGYLQAMTRAGLTVDEGWIIGGDSTERGGREAMERLLAHGGVGSRRRETNIPVPTAVFASNDLMAIGALRAARAAGLRVPRDVSIVGFDGIPMAEVVEPPLTSVKQPIYALGRRLADVLLAALERADSSGQVQREIVPGQLVVRGSTAAPSLRGDPFPSRGVIAGA